MSFQIITPGRFIDVSDPIGAQLNMEGWFTMEAVRNGKVVRKRSFKEGDGLATVGPFQNLILNLGLDKFGTEGQITMMRYFKVGVGTAAPAITDTQLVNQVGANVAATTDATLPGEAPDYISRMICTGLSSIGAFGTANLTEIGIGGWEVATLFSRALIVDAVGTPVSFPISSDEQLRLSYEARLYPPLTDATFAVDVAGPRTATVRALGVTTAASWAVKGPLASSGGVNATPGSPTANTFSTGGLGLITASTPQGSQVSSTGSTITTQAYSPGTCKLGHRQSWPSTSGNSESLRTHRVAYGCCVFQVQYDPPLSKASDQAMYLDYELSWGRR